MRKSKSKYEFEYELHYILSPFRATDWLLVLLLRCWCARAYPLSFYARNEIKLETLRVIFAGKLHNFPYTQPSVHRKNLRENETVCVKKCYWTFYISLRSFSNSAFSTFSTHTFYMRFWWPLYFLLHSNSQLLNGFLMNNRKFSTALLSTFSLFSPITATPRMKKELQKRGKKSNSLLNSSCTSLWTKINTIKWTIKQLHFLPWNIHHAKKTLCPIFYPAIQFVRMNNKQVFIFPDEK